MIVDRNPEAHTSGLGSGKGFYRSRTHEEAGNVARNCFSSCACLTAKRGSNSRGEAVTGTIAHMKITAMYIQFAKYGSDPKLKETGFYRM